VDRRLSEFLRLQASSAADSRLPSTITRTLGDFLSAGGKRLRPTLCVLGYLAAGRECRDLDEGVVEVAASLEMFHAYALIHDDVMDGSDTRRGRPTVHRALASYYRGLAARRGDRLRAGLASRFGTAGAILLGDFALAWSDAMLNGSGLDSVRLAAVRRVVDAMRGEVMFGQWLDIHTVGRPETDIAAPLTVARYKTARYSFQRPMEVGATLAGADAGVMGSLEMFANPLGEAFQLRDDLLGVFGDPVVTGKPVGDDLRDGKRTVLLAIAFSRVGTEQRRVLRRLIGNRHLDLAGVQEVRSVLLATGAVAEVERLIEVRRARALAAVDASPIAPPVVRALRRIAVEATVRTA
jgi:geranylgeranyl diphosphate synthase type I